MDISLPRVRRTAMIALGVAITALVVALYFANRDSAGAATGGADKVTVAANTAPTAGPGESVTVLETTVQSSDTADLAFSLTAECVIATTIETDNDDTQNAMGKVEMWIEVDDVAVPVASIPKADDGKVTFCDESHERTTFFTDPQANIKTVDRDGDANAFNWTKLNIGSGSHDIKVKATLTETASNKATAEAIIGKRTLHVFPTHMAPNAAF